MKKILALDGSLAGSEGNTSEVVRRMGQIICNRARFDVISLKDTPEIQSLEAIIRASDGFIFATGTYWQSWGSPLQKFFEEMTRWEATDLWIGKPAASVVTMHSVGGLEVVSRIQLNLTMMGLLIPPNSCVVHSLVSQLARTVSDSDDIWDLKYLPIVCHNLLEAVYGTHTYKAWGVERSPEAEKRWIAAGEEF